MNNNPSSSRKPYLVSCQAELHELADKYSSFSARGQDFCACMEQSMNIFLDMLDDPDLDGYEFAVSSESAKKILGFAAGTCFPPYIVFNGTHRSGDENMPSYTIIVKCLYDMEEPDSFDLAAGTLEIFRVTPDGRISLRILLAVGEEEDPDGEEPEPDAPDDLQFSDWIEDEETQTVHDVLCRGGMAALFLAGFASSRGIHPYYLHDPAGLLRENGELVRLADMLGGLVTFGYGPPGDPDGAVIIPGNMKCCGSCVRFADGAYVLCQLIDPADMTLAMETEGFQYRVSAAPTATEEERPGPSSLLVPVCAEAEAEKMIPVIRNLWDYYPTSEDMVYVLPLSDSRTVITKNPFRDLDVFCAGSGDGVSAEDLEEEEKKRYDKLRELFNDTMCF